MPITQKLVFVNILFCLILLVFLYFYTKIYPKKSITLFSLLVLISIIPVLSIFRPGTYESGDLSLHAMEAMSFFDALKEGILIPRWGAELNATYGYPVFLFAYPLPNYVISFFHAVGFSFIDGVKLLLATSFIASGIAMFWWLKEEIGEKGAFVGSIFYLFAPYHLIDLHFRVAIGEVLAFVFMPLILFGSLKYIKTRGKKWFALTAFSVAALILSHQAISLIFFPAALVYSFLKIKNKFRSLFYLFPFLTGLLLSCFYWLPVLSEKQYTVSGLSPALAYFEEFKTFIYSPWRYGLLFQGPHGEYALLIGYIQLVLVLFSLYLFFKKRFSKEIKKLYLFALFGFVITFFMLQSISKPIWQIIFILNNMQFSYRLLSLVVLFTAIIAACVSVKISKKWIYIICFIAIFSTILNWGNRRTIPEITDATLRQQIPESTAQGEGNGQSAPKWVRKTTLWETKVPKNYLEFLMGDGEIKNTMRTSTHHEYIIYTPTSAMMKENTLYFPGWTVYVNNQKVPIFYTDTRFPGVMTFNVPRGIHKLSVKYEETLIEQIGEGITIVSFGLLLILFIMDKPYFLFHKSK